MRLPRGRTLLGEILWTPVSVSIWMLSIAWLSGLAIVSVPIAAVIPFHRWQLKFTHPLTGWPCWFAFGPVRTHVDPDYRYEPSMFMQNHVSMLDGCIATASIRVPLCGLENASHLKVPGYGWIMRLASAIPVDRRKKDFLADIREAIHERIDRGISVLTFPEGHRTLDGKVRKFKRGVFRMALDSGIPVVPICVRGAYRVFPKGTFTVRPGFIDVYIAPQIETKGLTQAHLPLLQERVHQVMEAWVERGEKLGHLCKEPFPELEELPEAEDPPQTSAVG